MSPDLFFKLQKDNVWAKLTYTGKYKSEVTTEDVRLYRQWNENHVRVRNVQGEYFCLPKSKITNIERIFYITNFVKWH